MLGVQVCWVGLTGNFPQVNPLASDCCTHKRCVSICRSLSRPWQLLMPMAADESVHTLTGIVNQKSAMSDWKPKPIPEARITPLNSASPLDKATPVCVLLHDLIV